MKKIIDLLKGTSIIWSPILVMIIAQKLTTIITAEMFLNAIWVMGGITGLLLLKGDIKKCLVKAKK